MKQHSPYLVESLSDAISSDSIRNKIRKHAFAESSTRRVYDAAGTKELKNQSTGYSLGASILGWLINNSIW